MRDIQNRSIRNIPINPSNRRAMQGGRLPPPRDYDDSENNEGGAPPPRRPVVPRRRTSRIVWLCGGTFFVCAIAGLLLSTIFEGAQVTVTPKTVVLTEAKELIATQSGLGSTLVYKTITVTQVASTSLTTSGSQHVSRAAMGKVTISNFFSANPQILSMGTRLTSADGKIFRTKNELTVPGTQTKADGTILPGSIVVFVTADKPGTEYNLPDQTMLSILGFKGDARYTKITAKITGEISGGLVGDEPAVSPADEAKAQNDLKKELDSSIRSIIIAQIPSDYVGVNGTLQISYTDITQKAVSQTSVSLSEGVSATVAILKISDMAEALTKQTVKDYTGEPVELADLSKTTVSLKSSTGSSTTALLTLAVTGTPILVWKIDTDAIQKALLGKSKTQFPSIIKSFEPSVAKAQASIRPFWKADFPTNPGKLKVEVSK